MGAHPWTGEREAVLETAQELSRLGLVAGHSGNVSMRVGADPLLIAVTPSQHPYRSLRAADILVVDAEAEPVFGELPPSSETLLHLAVYQGRPDVGAVIHAHSVYATICAVAGLEIPPVVDELVVIVGGGVPVADYSAPGSEELAAGASDALRDRDAALLRLHGLVGVGGDLASALAVCELVERAAQVSVWTRLLGREATLPPDVVDAEQAIYRMRREVSEQTHGRR